MKKEQHRARSVLDDLLDCDEGLRPSEIDFLDSMDGKREFDWSSAQIKWLDDIWERVC